MNPFESMIFSMRITGEALLEVNVVAGDTPKISKVPAGYLT